MMRARPTIGERARRFTLDLPLDAPDGFGGTVTTFQPGPQLWGAIEYLSASERSRAGRTEADVTHRVTLAYRDGVNDGMRLTLGPRRFRIKAASDPDGRGRDLVCLVEEMRP